MMCATHIITFENLHRETGFVRDGTNETSIVGKQEQNFVNFKPVDAEA